MNTTSIAGCDLRGEVDEHAVLDRRREHEVGRRSAPTPTGSTADAGSVLELGVDTSASSASGSTGSARRAVGRGSVMSAHSAVADLGHVRAGLVVVDVEVGRLVGRREVVEVLERRRRRPWRRPSGRATSRNVSPASRSSANRPTTRTTASGAFLAGRRSAFSPKCDLLLRRRSRRAASGSRGRRGRGPGARRRRSRCRRCGAGRSSSCSRRC